MIRKLYYITTQSSSGRTLYYDGVIWSLKYENRMVFDRFSLAKEHCLTDFVSEWDCQIIEVVCQEVSQRVIWESKDG